MFTRNSKNEIIEIRSEEFLTERDFYTKLWKMRYNININSQKSSFNQTLTDYIMGIILSI